MSDWLMNDDSDGGGYLGMDDPAMPDAAPAPPSAPTAVATPDAGGDWLGGDSSGGSDDWLGGSASQSPQDGYNAGAAPVMDSQGDWMNSGDAAVTPGAAPAQQYHDPYAQQAAAPAPIAMSTHGEISVTSPQLHQVAPSPRSVGGARGELSDLVLDVEVQVEVGLGNAALTVEEFLEMGRGSVVELDTPIDAPIELKVRGKLIARGQLVSINGSYGMRIVEMLNEEH
jgi:flagellar motor switch protein FliN/FliY